MLIFQVNADRGIRPGGTKGAAAHLRHVAGALMRRGHEVVTFSRARAEGSHPAPVRSLASMSSTVLVPDLVYERYSLGHLGGLELARRAGRPFVLEVNAPLVYEASRHRGLAISPGLVDVEARLFSEADVVLPVSDLLADFVAHHRGTTSGIRVVPNGADPTAFDAPRPDPDPTVVFLGHPKPWHGADRLVGLAARLCPEFPCLRVVVIGGGAGAAELRAGAEAAGVGGALLITGPVAQAEVASWLSRSWVGMAPYPPSEFFYFSPLKIVEYMMAGLPIVGSAVGSLDALVGTGGMMVDPADDEALTDAVRLLLADGDRRARMGAAGRVRAQRELTWDHAAQRIEEAVSVGSHR